MFLQTRSKCALVVAVCLVVLSAASRAAADSITLEWDGVDAQVTAPQNVNLTSSFTFDAWINPSSLANNPVVFEKGQDISNRVGLQVVSNGQIGGYLDSIGLFTVASPAGAIAANQFTHVAYVFDDAANQERLYVNGVQAGDKDTAAGKVPDAPAPGHDTSQTPLPMNGGGFALWGRAIRNYAIDYVSYFDSFATGVGGI